ncbi:pimeloyl-ACP methyl ester carboxylesterase [Streptomyces sp. 1114.5]|uniref:alpha/beta fold hydrolase n=1 Tax=unclassified Streptomyces TaxID=2593676 RepID=UPI000BC55183|nr:MULTISPECIES: alpha/beta hydrolase [unclassified Streptomyces]RKT15874.1 pimeloyl-ACP methyl ester carboxylesterase [Streptomyces sp. 1114.5]SOB82048.1 Pimeloyl-ACP methyl ester carboxylesterase [Streptomyces sp. 1331.2]
MTELPSAVSVRESGTGTPLVLLHAYPLNASMWSSQLDTLPGPTGAGARVLAPDQRGFGGTELGSDEPSLDHVADDLALLLDAAGIERAVVVGLSMGGYAALALARRHPGRLSGLLLANTRATADPDTVRANRERIAAAVTARDSVQLLLDERVAAGQLGPDSQHLVERVQTMVAAASPAAVAWAQRAMAARPDSLDVLAGLRVPVAVVTGAEDSLVAPEEAERMLRARPDAELTVIPGVGHLSALEAPEAFDTAVRALLDRVAAG